MFDPSGRPLGGCVSRRNLARPFAAVKCAAGQSCDLISSRTAARVPYLAVPHKGPRRDPVRTIAHGGPEADTATHSRNAVLYPFVSFDTGGHSRYLHDSSSRSTVCFSAVAEPAMSDVFVLTTAAILTYLLVLSAHSLRRRAGLGPFFALLGGLTAIMSWVTDAGVSVQVGGITFVLGSTVFYTGLLLGVFVLYVFDGPRNMRIAILAVAGVSILAPLIAAALHAYLPSVGPVPAPSLRVNVSSVITTMADFVFLAMAWEFLGRFNTRTRMWPRVYLTLLGVLWFDVFLFSTLAFGGTPAYLGILSGTFLGRTVTSVIAGPVLFLYVRGESRRPGITIEDRPVLAILRQMEATRAELSTARQEIERRREAEEQLAEVTRRLHNLTRRLYIAGEQEREQVGLELHDEIGQTLSAIKMDLSVIRAQTDSGDTDGALRGLDRMVSLLDATVERVRRLYTDLKPGMLDDLGLAATVEWQASEFSHRTGIRCSVGRFDDVALRDADARLAVFRVLQEALQNVAKHSGATRVDITAHQHDGYVTIRLHDNGWGIRQEDLDSPESTGLTDMRERMRPFDGCAEVSGQPGKGTTVRITVPLGEDRRPPG
jgi:signal transduction histidine kinase